MTRLYESQQSPKKSVDLNVPGYSSTHNSMLYGKSRNARKTSQKHLENKPEAVFSTYKNSAENEGACSHDPEITASTFPNIGVEDTGNTQAFI